MVFDQLANAHLYRGMSQRMAAAFEFLRTADLTSLALGKFPIAGNELYAMVQEYETKAPDAVPWEAHRRYIDVQYLVAGRERVGVGFIDDFEVIKEYDADGDYLLLKGSGDEIILSAGTFAIFMPHDVHQPTLAAEQPAKVRKIVVKVLID